MHKYFDFKDLTIILCLAIRGYGAYRFFNPSFETEAERLEATNSCQDCNLSVPIEIDLSNRDLENANLKGSNLNSLDIKNSDLRNAKLEGANLNGADLKYSDLRGANLSEADLRNTDMRNADLRDVNWSKAIFDNLTYGVDRQELINLGAIYQD